MKEVGASVESVGGMFVTAGLLLNTTTELPVISTIDSKEKMEVVGSKNNISVMEMLGLVVKDVVWGWSRVKIA